MAYQCPQRKYKSMDREREKLSEFSPNLASRSITTLTVYIRAPYIWRPFLSLFVLSQSDMSTFEGSPGWSRGKLKWQGNRYKESTLGPTGKAPTITGGNRFMPERWQAWEVDFLEKFFKATQYPSRSLREEWALILTRRRFELDGEVDKDPDEGRTRAWIDQ